MIEKVLEQVGGHLGIKRPSDLLPADTEWSASKDEFGTWTITVALNGETFEDDFQKDGPSAPSRALCLAFWLEHMGQQARVRVEIGETGRHTPGLRRAAFILEEYAQLFPRTLKVIGAPVWRWPRDPIFNVEGKRSGKGRGRGKEGKLARELCANRAIRESIASLDGDIEPLRDQLPVGLFSEEVNKENHWTPGNSAAVDLWSRTRDRKVVHLFELKVGKKVSVGILPQAFYYARMLAYVRDRRAIDFAVHADGLNAVRGAKFLKMWLSAENLHPLVYHPEHGSAPLTRFNKALETKRVIFGVLPVTAEPPSFRIDERWPAPA